MGNKKLSLALGLSILLNAFLIGFVISGCQQASHGPDLRHDRGRPPHQGNGFMSDIMNRQSKKLSEEGQKTLATIVAKYQDVLQADPMQQNDQVFQDIKKEMVAQHFNKAKVIALHKRLDESETHFKQQLGNMMTEIAASLKDKDRIAFFEDMMPDHPHPPGDRGPQDEEHGPPDDFGKPKD